MNRTFAVLLMLMAFSKGKKSFLILAITIGYCLFKGIGYFDTLLINIVCVIFVYALSRVGLFKKMAPISIIEYSFFCDCLCWYLIPSFRFGQNLIEYILSGFLFNLAPLIMSVAFGISLNICLWLSRKDIAYENKIDRC